MDEYSSVQRGPLKLKGSDSGAKKKKKKKRDKEKLKQIAQITSTDGGGGGGDQAASSSSTSHSHSSKSVDRRTKAEIAFEKAQAKRNMEMIMEKASKTHKERILDFNQHLDTLTEHFDIPKVSWTK